MNEYAANLSHQRFGMSLRPAPGSPMGLAIGLAWVIEPLWQFCSSAGGQLKVIREGWIDTTAVPTELDCMRDGRALWAFEPGYSNAKVTPEGSSGRLFATFDPVVRSAAEVVELRDAERLAEAEKKRAAEMKRQSDQAEAARQLEVARRTQLETAQREEEFRRIAKVGDRFQWPVPGRPITAVGTIIRFEGEMAFVQFDNLTMSGQPTRYLPRRELRPYDGKAPRVTYQID